MMMDHLLTIYQDYATAISLTLGLLPWKSIEATLQILHRVRVQQHTVFVIGSGSSGAAASHLACELDGLTPTSASDYPQFRVMALLDSMPVFAAGEEQRKYDSLASRLTGRLRAGDVVIAISSHGTSTEMVQALRHVRAAGGFTIGLGSDEDRLLAEEVNLPVLVPNDSLDQIEDAHQIIIHILVKALRRYRERNQFNWKHKWRITLHHGCTRHRRRAMVFTPSTRRWR